MNDFEKTDEIDSRPESIDTTDWKKCPFCKGEPRGFADYVGGNAVDRNDEHYDWWGMLGCHDCEFRVVVYGNTRDEVIAEIKRRWQSRAERTCHMVFENPKGDDHCHCDVCGLGYSIGDGVAWHGGRFIYLWSYCKNCGAKVVRDGLI